VPHGSRPGVFPAQGGGVPGVVLCDPRAVLGVVRGDHVHPDGPPSAERGAGSLDHRMKAVIMAGGEGTRLRPLTSNQPKPMLPLANRPMMEHIVRLLKEHGFDEIVVTLAFPPQAIRTYFGDGPELRVRP